ncbi:MAG: replicative DNA helicase [Myxococcales bacterium]|nr:replicative DNA helicase [Myxococcales bacterium]
MPNALQDPFAMLDSSSQNHTDFSNSSGSDVDTNLSSETVSHQQNGVTYTSNANEGDVGPGFFDGEGPALEPLSPPLPDDSSPFLSHRDDGDRSADPSTSPHYGQRSQQYQPSPRRSARAIHSPVAHAEFVPPADLTTERAILAACLSDSEAIALAQTAMRTEDLYDQRHRVAFEAVKNVAMRGDTPDPVNVVAEVERLGHGELVTLPYLVELAFSAGTTEAIESYARRVAKLAVVRNVLDVTHKLQVEGYRRGVDPDAFLDNVDRLFRAAMDSAVRGGPQRVGELVNDVYNTIMEAMHSGGTGTGVRTGFRDIDHRHLGLHPTDLIVLAARPAMGKSAFALNLAYQVAKQPRRKGQLGRCRVVIFSLEMGREQLVQRFFSARSRVDLTALRKGELTPEDESSLRQAAAELGELDIYIDDTAGLTPTDIRARCKRVAMQGPIDFVVVDYLQLMHGTGGERQSTENAIAECSQALKGLAKELHCTVLALSQLNREVENRSGRKPQMSDLRGSGSIEQDADIIWFIHREHYYDNTKDENLAELIVAKYRSGETGSIKLHFEGRLTKFGTYDDRINDQFAYGGS